MKHPDFTVNVKRVKDGTWKAEVYDHNDHGDDQPYAKVESHDLLNVVNTAAHYVFVAGRG
jgi:hypothetical protein